MANNPTTGTPTASPKPAEDAANAAQGAGQTAQREMEKGERAAEQVAEKTAEASKEAVRANGEILRRNFETAQEALRTGLETGVKSVEGLTQSVTRAFGVSSQNGDLAEQSAQNVRAISQASIVLARGAQEASRAWFDLIQQGVRTNLEAMSDLARCRSVQDVMALQSKVMRENLQTAIDRGQTIAQTSSQAIGEASRAMQPGAGESPRA